MDDDAPLSDDEAHARLVVAWDMLGTAPGATVHADTALQSARRALMMLQVAVIFSSEKAAGRLPPAAPKRRPRKRPAA